MGVTLSPLFEQSFREGQTRVFSVNDDDTITLLNIREILGFDTITKPVYYTDNGKLLVKNEQQSELLANIEHKVWLGCVLLGGSVDIIKQLKVLIWVRNSHIEQYFLRLLSCFVDANISPPPSFVIKDFLSEKDITKILIKMGYMSVSEFAAYMLPNIQFEQLGKRIQTTIQTYHQEVIKTIAEFFGIY